MRTNETAAAVPAGPTFQPQQCTLPESCAGATGSRCHPCNMAVEPGSSLCEHVLWQVHSNAMQSMGVTDCWTMCVDITTYHMPWRHVVTHLLLLCVL
mgnify:CR=1 FL=1